MKITILHGSPRKGNTNFAVQIFKEELSKCGDIDFREFFFPRDLPEFCTGCTICMGGLPESCPHAQYVRPILSALLDSDALIIAAPHYGASAMPAGLKTFFDHLDFLTLTVTPRKEMFSKKAFIITTATGSKAAIASIKSCLKNWGINRAYSYGIRMLTNKWDKMSQAKQQKIESVLRRKARFFYNAKQGKPYISTIFMYHMSKFILRRYVGKDSYPYKYWTEQGWFFKRPF
ncbi:MAG: NAD(P)H-dependent oxidoreductase [Oscillospiraceae bacterium]|jgi:multimeric flavodoxin WrbA|nr:NAD(P)H-dependent oxidoreductase [Oscillospiraceae bacterium]